MKASEARELVALIQAAYPRQPWPEPTVALFADELQRIPMDQERAHGAVRTMLRTRRSEFAPSLAEILHALIGYLDAAPSFDETWAEMCAKASRGDYFRPDEPPHFSHPAITRMARMIGWRAFTNSSEGDTYLRHAAERIYDGIVEHRRALVLESPDRAAELLAGDETVDAELRALVAGIGDDNDS